MARNVSVGRAVAQQELAQLNAELVRERANLEKLQNESKMLLVILLMSTVVSAILLLWFNGIIAYLHTVSSLTLCGSVYGIGLLIDDRHDIIESIEDDIKKRSKSHVLQK